MTHLNEPHICQGQYWNLPNMREFYRANNVIPTSENADVMLIRSHIAYWSGNDAANRAVIKPSRGHSYRVNKDCIVRIRDYYDHRDGITGWTQTR